MDSHKSRGPMLNDLGAVQKAIEAVDAHFPTSAAYSLLSDAMGDGCAAFLAAQDRDALVLDPAVCAAFDAVWQAGRDQETRYGLYRAVIDALLGGVHA